MKLSQEMSVIFCTDEVSTADTRSAWKRRTLGGVTGAALVATMAACSIGSEKSSDNTEGARVRSAAVALAGKIIADSKTTAPTDTHWVVEPKMALRDHAMSFKYARNEYDKRTHLYNGYQVEMVLNNSGSKPRANKVESITVTQQTDKTPNFDAPMTNRIESYSVSADGQTWLASGVGDSHNNSSNTTFVNNTQTQSVENFYNQAVHPVQ